MSKAKEKKIIDRIIAHQLIILENPSPGFIDAIKLEEKLKKLDERADFESFALIATEDASEHRWTTFPEMVPDEVVVFRAYDSDRVGTDQPFWTPHTAFRDPNTGPDAPPRESLEMRAICLFR